MSGSSGGAAARPNRIDGAVGDKDIANMWAAKFGSILNSLEDEAHRKEFFKHYNHLEDEHIDHVMVDDIKTIINKLKDGSSWP